MLAQCSKIGKSAISKVQKYFFYNFKNGKKINFCTWKKFKTTKNAILDFFLVQKLIFLPFLKLQIMCFCTFEIALFSNFRAICNAKKTLKFSRIIFWYNYLKLVGSLRNVICSCSRNLFIPVNKDCGVQALVVILGVPSNTMTRSAKYVAIIKSCSTTNPVFLAWRMNRLMTWEY